jgi:electron transport complex protein RnfB
MGARALVDAVLDALPQTQCRRCGYADCRSYADAITTEGAAINRCPPGGAEGVARLALLTGRATLPLDPDCGREGPRALAVIDEQQCIGCALCLKACPVDAIVGAAKQMHAVIDASCTGCELCIPVCPVDCISLVDVSAGRTGWAAWDATRAAEARRRYARHAERLATGTAPAPADSGQPARSATVAAAIARARAARGEPR